MRIHHLNCASFAPFGGRLISNDAHGVGCADMVTHCLLLETEAGLVLVDTGFGAQDIATPRQTLRFPLVPALRPRLDLAETAAHQVVQLGYQLTDVRHIVLTHLDLDHAGGLRDFPHAQVHVSAAELTAARFPATVAERRRYIHRQFDHNPAWVKHSEGALRWFGFSGVRTLAGLPPTILAVPLTGHTRGHCGIAIDTGTHGSARWLLHAGDSFFAHSQIRHAPSCPPLLSAFQVIAQTDRRARLDNLARLRHVAAKPDVDIICAHDPLDLATSLQRQQVSTPTTAPERHDDQAESSRQ